MSSRPNVLLICTDHWPGALLGCEGHPVIQTPTIDELSRNGVRFSRAYSECPVCIPARRTLMTGTTPRTHGDRIFQTRLPMPDLPTLAQTFRNAGYQAYASGKLHVYPQRDRIGFDDVLLAEEGRAQYGVVDDYELFLADNGHPGAMFAHGMSNNQYVTRAWHLDERLHNTNWTAAQMERMIRRRDPTRPAFWYLSFAHPHPPLAPPAYYLDLYRRLEIDAPTVGDWASDPEALPHKLRKGWELGAWLTDEQRRDALCAFYALCTQIDHQIRRVIGTLREENVLENTCILFTADHGDMLGRHGLWAKRCFYEWSARIPMILCPPEGDRSAGAGANRVDNRLVGMQDIMPTLLDICEIDIPQQVEGRSMVSAEPRELLYGEEGEGVRATRMIHDGRYKLIYYAAGNRLQLFDLERDPLELRNLASEPEHAATVARLKHALIDHLHGSDLEWLRAADAATGGHGSATSTAGRGTQATGGHGRELVGLAEPEYRFTPVPGLFGQRGTHWPPPPATGAEIQEPV